MRNRLISSIAVSAFVLAASGSAFAADIAVKAPPPAPPPAPTWTGFYVGGNIGASFGNVKTDFNVAPYTITQTNIGTPAPFTTFPGVAGSDQVYPSGFIGGGQIAYNWQFSPIWVVGFEADFQGADEKESSNLSNALNGNPIIQGGGQPAIQ